MSHPVLWPKTIFFYPIGNTPAVCLTQDLAPEESAEILLLGCGDPRSILHTLHAGVKSLTKPRILDFTCCDFEPAVLARNVLLFTLIYDGHDINQIWNIFYHFKIDDASLSLLVSQCKKLNAISTDVKVWHSSTYSSFLRFCSERTLSQLHEHWRLYAKAATFSQEKERSFSAAIAKMAGGRNGAQTVDLILTPARSAGLFLAEAANLLSANFHHYWRTGTVSMETRDIASARRINPTFTYSVTGEGFAVHYGTYPLQGFHLAATFVEVTSASQTNNSVITEADLINCAKAQFRQWCAAFKSAVTPGSNETVIIRLFSGDALAFCKTLYQCQLTSSTSSSFPVSSWTGAEVVLNGRDYGLGTASAPTSFNVIDTSNIIDHLGLLNILIVSVPLLRQRPSATLYTEALLLAGTDPMTGFLTRLCTEVSTIAVLLGVAPTAYMSNFTSHSNIHEIMLLHSMKNKAQYHERIGWKIPYLGDLVAVQQCGERRLHPSFEPQALARLLFNIYYHMFAAGEDLQLRMEEALQGILGESILHYHRGTFVSFLALVKSRVKTDWDLVMDTIFDLLHTDQKLLLGSNYYQELCCQLHLCGVYSVETFRPQQNLVTVDRAKGIFEGWKHVPPVTCLVLVVPRERIKILEGADSDRHGSPMLQCEIRTSTYQNIFSCIHVMFGTVSIEGEKSSARVIVTEDKSGLSGSSSLVISFWVPSWTLAVDPLRTRVGLGVQSTPATAMTLTSKLGLELCLFSTGLVDETYVHVVRCRPHVPAELNSLNALRPCSPQPSSDHGVSVSMGDACEKVHAFVLRTHVTDQAAKQSLLGGSEVTSIQDSPCSMKVTYGGFSKSFVYPFPINGQRAKLRIARKSSYIEVVVPISGPCLPGGFALKNFPLMLEGGLSTLWNLHRLSLRQLPIIDLTQQDKLLWIRPHVSSMFSDRERARREGGFVKGGHSTRDTLIQVKDTLHCLLVRAAEQRRVFGLAAPSRGGVYTLVFVNNLRLDLASHTLVLDACVLPLTDQLLQKLGQKLARLNFSAATGMLNISTNDDELVAWKHLLPAFTDRCRTWSHKPSCEYVKTGRVPLSLEMAQSPICGCGKGVDLGAFSNTPAWKEFAPYVTRAALSPLFAVSYVDTVAGFLKTSDTALMTERTGETCSRCGGPGKPTVLKCSRCKRASYCGADCQRADWKEHKRQCAKK